MPETVLQEGEAAVDRQRRRGQDRGPHVVEEQLLQAPRDVDGHGAKEDAASPGLDEVDVAVLLGLEEERQLSGEGETAAREAGEGLRAVGDGQQRRPQPLETLEQRQRLLGAPGRDPVLGQRAGGAPGEDLEQALRPHAHARDLDTDLPGVEPGGLELALHVPGQLLHPVGGDLHPEVLGGDVLHEVRLVEDHGVVGRDHLAVAALLDREVGAQQVVVHHHDVGLQGPLAHLRHEARVEEGARLADAVLAGGGDLPPEIHGVGQVRDLRPVAGLGLGGPVLDCLEEGHLVGAAKGPALRKGLVAKKAQVVGPPLHDRHRQVPAEGLGQERDVLGDQLLLEVLGAGGDDHPTAELDRGQQVGEGLPGAGAGLGQEQAAVLEDALDRLGEPLLRRPLLVALEDLRQEPAATEEGSGGHFFQKSGVRITMRV